MESLNFTLGWAYLQEQLPVHVHGDVVVVSQRLYIIYGPDWRPGLNDLTMQPMEIDSSDI